jgi:hypothetical protein
MMILAYRWMYYYEPKSCFCKGRKKYSAKGAERMWDRGHEKALADSG